MTVALLLLKTTEPVSASTITNPTTLNDDAAVTVDLSTTPTETVIATATDSTLLPLSWW